MVNRKKCFFDTRKGKNKFSFSRKSATTAKRCATKKRWNAIYVGEAQLNESYSEIKRSMVELRNVLGEIY